MIKKFSIAIICALALLPMLAGCGGMPKNAVAQVKGDAITLNDLDKQMDLYVKTSGLTMPEQGTEEYTNLRIEVLEYLIADKIFALEAEERGITVTDEEVDETLNQMKDQSGGEEVFQKQLDTMGLTMDQIQERVRYDLLFRKVQAEVVKDATQVTDAEVKAYYDEHVADFTTTQETRQVKHILVTTLDEANQVKARLAAGEDFGALAAELSLDTGSASNGGRLPQPVPTTDSGLVPEFEQAMDSLAAGQISDPVQTQYGYHIIVVEKIIPPGVQPFEDVKEQIRQQMQTLQNDYDYFLQWFEDAKVKYEVVYAEGYAPPAKDETGSSTAAIPDAATDQPAVPAP